MDYSADLELLVMSVRAFLEPRWHKTKRRAGYLGEDEFSAEGMAKPSAKFLANICHERFGGRWAVCAGVGDDSGGLLSTSGDWVDHFWVYHKGLVLDVAGDPYGHPQITVEEEPARYKRTLSPSDVAVLLRRVEPLTERWLKEWRTLHARH